MHALTLHNSLTRRKERFVPLDPHHVRMYVLRRAMLVDRPCRSVRSTVVGVAAPRHPWLECVGAAVLELRWNV